MADETTKLFLELIAVDKITPILKKVSNVLKGVFKTEGTINKLKYMSRVLGKVGQGLHKMSQNFQGWALSLLFMGMMLQRIFTGILKSTVSAFLKITEGTTEAGKAINSLTVWWEYLKFTIGNAIATALQPLIPHIINIIKNVKEWIEQHPKLTATIVIVGLVLGFLFMALGQVVMGVFGLIGVLWLLNIVLTVLSANPIILIVAAIILFIVFCVLAYFAVKNNWGGITTMLIDFFGRVARGFAILKYLFDTIFIGISETFKFGWALMENITSMAWNNIVTCVEDGVNKMIDAVNVFIDAYNWVANKLHKDPITPLLKADFSATKAEVKSMSQILKEYEDNLASAIGARESELETQLGTIEYNRLNMQYQADNGATGPRNFQDMINNQIGTINFNMSEVMDSKKMSEEIEKKMKELVSTRNPSTVF